jgi:anti-sigma B factor antagonist
MILVKPSEKIEKLLLITKLNNIFSIVESKEEAIELLKAL